MTDTSQFLFFSCLAACLPPVINFILTIWARLRLEDFKTISTITIIILNTTTSNTTTSTGISSGPEEEEEEY